MNHTDYWTIAKVIQERAVTAARGWDLAAAKTLNALAAEFSAMGDKAEAEYLKGMAEQEGRFTCEQCSNLCAQEQEFEDGVCKQCASDNYEKYAADKADLNEWIRRTR
jgi:Zn finger protein HypA/HybF involved in hydrogenase expression